MVVPKSPVKLSVPGRQCRGKGAGRGSGSPKADGGEYSSHLVGAVSVPAQCTSTTIWQFSTTGRVHTRTRNVNTR